MSEDMCDYSLLQALEAYQNVEKAFFALPSHDQWAIVGRHRRENVMDILDTRVWANTILNTKTGAILPSGAIITLAEWVRVISQEWLAYQPPPQAFIDAGGEVFDRNNPYPEKERGLSRGKMRCWCRGKWYWNSKWEEWLAQYYGWKTETIHEITWMSKRNRWKDNNATMKAMWVVPAGYLHEYFDSLNSKDDCFIRSNPVRGHSHSDDSLRDALCFRSAWHETPEETIQTFVFTASGVIPFIVLSRI